MINSEIRYRYLLYAMGEIALVVIGILIALQINNWNEERKLYQQETNLLSELKANLQTNIDNLESDIAIQVRSAEIIDFLIDHLDNKRPYHDSLDFLFKKADFAPDVILTASAFETLKSTGLDLIRSDTLRRTIINLFEVVYPYLIQETRRLEDQVWPAVVVPINHKYFRTTAKRYIPNNYEALLNDPEFLNMLSFRGNLRKGSTAHKRRAAEHTANVINLIEEELSARRIL